MKIRTIWVNLDECWEGAWLFHAEDEYTSEDNTDLWPEMMEEAAKKHPHIRVVTIEVPEQPIADLFDKTLEVKGTVTDD